MNFRVVAPGLLMAIVCSVAGLSQTVKPLDESGLVALLRLGLDEQTVVARIKKGPVALEAGDAILDRLRTAGATEDVIQAVRVAVASKPAVAGSVPVEYRQVLQMLSLGLDEEAILRRLAKSPTVFALGQEQIAELKAAGATNKLLTALQTPRDISPQTAELITNFALVLDCSGSMKEKTTGGETKMEAAQRVVVDLIQNIPEGLNVTFVIYGHEVFASADDPRNCQAVKVARALSPLDTAGRSDLIRLVAGLRPTGATPIALSLKVAGKELEKDREAFCGIVLITDGLESCTGDPTAEAAALLTKLKLSFGINVVGFGVRPEESAALEAIAEAGKGTYFAAEDAKALADSISSIADELKDKSRPAEIIVVSRRALRVLQPEIELPAMKEVYLAAAGAADGGVFTKVATIDKYGEYLAIPSATKKYDVVWVPKVGKQVYLMRDFAVPERKVVTVKPETIFGMIRVKGEGKVRNIIAMPAGHRPVGVYRPTSQVQNYGDTLVVPAGKYDVHVNSASGKFTTIEQELDVAAGKLIQLE